ncbi:MAG: hypothetical protein QNJ47_13230 [Nostocaceae cyanobacterium]|nr:hypothetical protein [Nostocaceae cyanobacterium]
MIWDCYINYQLPITNYQLSIRHLVKIKYALSKTLVPDVALQRLEHSFPPDVYYQLSIIAILFEL